MGFFIFFFISGALSFFYYRHPNNPNQDVGFWGLGVFLVTFTALRPYGLGADDMAYTYISNSICAFSECLKLIQSPRDWAWYSLIGLIKSFINGPRAVMVLSALGLLIQLYIVYRVSRHKLLSLTFFIPYVYLIFNFTIFRANLALSVYFLAIYLLVSPASIKRIYGGSLLATNYFFHTQGIFSIILLPMHWLTRYKKICLVIGGLCLTGIFLGLTPTLDQLSFLAKAEAAPYLAQALDGQFKERNMFPQVGLFVLTYLLILFAFEKKLLLPNRVNQYVLASTMLALFLAWFFAPILTMQIRLFDFYMAPLVFIVGNLRLNKWTYWGTIFVASLLYARLELLHNFILG